MARQLLSRTQIPFAPVDENTYGLEIWKEVWKTKRGEETYWKYSLPDGVQIFALTTGGKVIAISEWQPSVGADYLHLPGETMEKGETPLEAAVRGLREETGYEAGQTKLLSSILENSGKSDRLGYVVLMTNCKKTEQEGEAEIKTVLLSPSEFWNCLMQYFAMNPESKHGGGNTLKATVLALNQLGLISTLEMSR